MKKNNKKNCQEVHNEIPKKDNPRIEVSFSAENTTEIASRFARELKAGDIVCITGDLGTGKTAFTQGIARTLGIQEYITSPTFTLVNQYDGDIPLYHFDVYRINDPDEIYETGFEEYIYGEGITVIEWADLIRSMLPKKCIWIHVEKDVQKGENYRKISIGNSIN